MDMYTLLRSYYFVYVFVCVWGRDRVGKYRHVPSIRASKKNSAVKVAVHTVNNAHH